MDQPKFAAEQKDEHGRWGKFTLGLDEALYHADRTAVSQGQLINADESPAHFIEAFRSPYVDDSDEKDALVVGKLFHMAALEQSRFAATVFPEPDFGDMRKTENKEKKAAWAKDLPEGAQLVDEAHHTLARELALSLHATPTASKYLSGAVITEASGWWVDPQSGLLLRMRADAINDRGKIVVVVDLKSARKGGAQNRAFRRAIQQRGYHFQAAHYVAGAEAITGKPAVYVWIVAEKEPPYQVQVYVATESLLAQAEAQRRRCLNIVSGCVETKRWPRESFRYPGGEQEIDLLEWHARELAEGVEVAA